MDDKEIIGRLAEIAKSSKLKKKKKKKKRSSRLQVFADGEAIKLAQKLFFGYISQTDMGGYLQFLMALDDLMIEERRVSRSPINLNPDDEEEEDEYEEEGDQGDPAERARRYRSEIDEDEDDGDDDDEVDIKIPKAAKMLTRKLVKANYNVFAIED